MSFAFILATAACGGSLTPLDGDPATGETPDAGLDAPKGDVVVANGREPKVHRAAPKPCDSIRSNQDPNVPDSGGAPASCHTHAECTEGVNGRCIGNGHDGWRCTYDLCSNDSQCNGGVCECEGAFRSDNNVCLASGCKVDADCGSRGFCSPSLGSCGHFGKTAGYFCHTPKDECVDDEDCASTAPQGGQKPYCKYEEAVGHWKCSTQECAG